jgi:hypothetical protein
MGLLYVDLFVTERQLAQLLEAGTPLRSPRQDAFLQTSSTRACALSINVFAANDARAKWTGNGVRRTHWITWDAGMGNDNAYDGDHTLLHIGDAYECVSEGLPAGGMSPGRRYSRSTR